MLMITTSIVFLYACMTSLFHALGQVTKFSMMMVENLARGPGRIVRTFGPGETPSATGSPALERRRYSKLATLHSQPRRLRRELGHGFGGFGFDGGDGFGFDEHCQHHGLRHA